MEAEARMKCRGEWVGREKRETKTCGCQEKGKGRAVTRGGNRIKGGLSKDERPV